MIWLCVWGGGGNITIHSDEFSFVKLCIVNPTFFKLKKVGHIN